MRLSVCLLSAVSFLFTKSHLEASNTKTAQSKDVWYDNLGFLDGQLFVYFHLFVYFSQKSLLQTSNTKTAQNKDVWNENLEILRWSAVSLLSSVCLLFSNKPLRGF